MLAEYEFHRSVFVLPPWESIYTTDAERDQSFAEAVAVHARIVEWYTACGYVLHEVPRLPVRGASDVCPPHARDNGAMTAGAPYLVNVRVKAERIDSQEYPFNLPLIRSSRSAVHVRGHVLRG
jgi:hypothetical protein